MQGRGTRITCEGNEAFLVRANERLPRRIEDVGREAGGEGELVCWISAIMKGRASGAAVVRTQCHEQPEQRYGHGCEQRMQENSQHWYERQC
jgi:hypothetical protein